MTPAQDYKPFRQAVLSRDELRQLSELRPSRAIVNAAANWLVILAAWAVVAAVPAWWTVIPAIVVIGTRYYALAIIGHDGLHRRLFPTQAANDLFNDVVVIGAIGAITRINRVNHIEHHRITAHSNDPDRHKYLHDDKEVTLPFLLFLTGLANVWPTVRNIFLRGGGNGRNTSSGSGHATGTTERHGRRDILIIVGWQVLLFGGLTYFIGWWAYPVVWILPVYVFAYLGDLLRVFCEHSMLTSDAHADLHKRMIHYDSNWLERQFFAPNNMNCHIAHHLWPSIPYYNLPAAEAKVRDWAARHDHEGQMQWRPSYVLYLLEYFHWRRARGPNVGYEASGSA